MVPSRTSSQVVTSKIRVMRCNDSCNDFSLQRSLQCNDIRFSRGQSVSENSPNPKRDGIGVLEGFRVRGSSYHHRNRIFWCQTKIITVSLQDLGSENFPNLDLDRKI